MKSTVWRNIERWRLAAVLLIPISVLAGASLPAQATDVTRASTGDTSVSLREALIQEGMTLPGWYVETLVNAARDARSNARKRISHEAPNGQGWDGRRFGCLTTFYSTAGMPTEVRIQLGSEGPQAVHVLERPTNNGSQMLKWRASGQQAGNGAPQAQGTYEKTYRIQTRDATMRASIDAHGAHELDVDLHGDHPQISKHRVLISLTDGALTARVEGPKGHDIWSSDGRLSENVIRSLHNGNQKVRSRRDRAHLALQAVAVALAGPEVRELLPVKQAGALSVLARRARAELRKTRARLATEQRGGSTARAASSAR